MEKIKPYINISYQYTDIDWNVSAEGKFETTAFRARRCKREDLGPHENGDMIMKSWEAFSFICPDWENSGLEGKTWKLRGSMSSWIIKRGEFVV